jgi:hypothetical protein
MVRNTMGSVECKRVKGNWYAYYVTVRRVKGKPHPVKDYKYMGPIGDKYVRVDKIAER